MIRSFSGFCCYFLTSLILSTEEIPVEYKLMTCLPKTFSVFSPFTFSSRYLYSAYLLLIVSSLALPTFSLIHLSPNKYVLPLSMTLFKLSRFLCCSMPSYCVSIISPKNSPLFNIFSTSAIVFTAWQSRHHMRNNVRYKGNINNTSIFNRCLKWPL